MYWLAAAIVSALIGAAVTYLLPILVRLPRHAWRTTTRAGTIEGHWFEYHLTRQNSKAITDSHIFVIRKALDGRFRFRTEPNPKFCQPTRSLGRHLWRRSHEGAITYRGTIHAERDSFVFTMVGQNYDVTATVRMFSYVPKGESVVPALWLSFDFDGRPTAGPMIFSRNQLTEDDARLQLRAVATVIPPARQLMLARR